METYAETTGPLHQTIAQLKKPPKWLKRPIGASFAVRGYLFIFKDLSSFIQPPLQYNNNFINISKLILMELLISACSF